MLGKKEIHNPHVFTNTSKHYDKLILVVLRCRFKRSKSITHTTSMIFLLYQTQHHQIRIEIDSTVTIYPRDENA